VVGSSLLLSELVFMPPVQIVLLLLLLLLQVPAILMGCTWPASG
jgi:hypothetical protein